MLGQAEIGRLFDRCGDDPNAIEEVLSAYLAHKFRKGYNVEAVFVRLKHLTYYLRGSGRISVLEIGREQFTQLGLEVKRGGGRIGVCPAMSEAGKEAWNQLRKADNKRPFTTHVHGGPGSVLNILAAHQLQDVSSAPLADSPSSEQYFHNRYKLNPPPPPYTQDRFGHGGSSTLPLYESTGSRQEVGSTADAVQELGDADNLAERIPEAGPSGTHDSV